MVLRSVELAVEGVEKARWEEMLSLPRANRATFFEGQMKRTRRETAMATESATARVGAEPREVKGKMSLMILQLALSPGWWHQIKMEVEAEKAVVMCS